MANLPNESATEEKLFFIMFKELIESIGWNYFNVESNLGNALYFGPQEDIVSMMQNGYVFNEYISTYQAACIKVLEIKYAISNIKKPL